MPCWTHNSPRCIMAKSPGRSYRSFHISSTTHDRFKSATASGGMYHFRQNSENLGASRRQDYTTICVSVIERSKTAIPTGSTFVFDMRDLRIMQNIRRIWSFINAVPRSFLSEDSDETMVDAEADPDSGSSSSNNHGMK